MVTFYCDGCGAVVCFESVTCVACGRALGFLPDVMSDAMSNDGYPHVLSPQAIEKLRVVHEVITAARGMRSGPRMMAGCPA